MITAANNDVAALISSVLTTYTSATASSSRTQRCDTSSVAVVSGKPSSSPTCDFAIDESATTPANKRLKYDSDVTMKVSKGLKTKSSKALAPQAPLRRSKRGNSSIATLADHVTQNKNIVIITGAGLSVPSGIRPFRGKNGIWSSIIWTKATRHAFRSNPLDFYNSFWLPHFPPHMYSMENQKYKPNAGHEAIAQIAVLNPNVKVITQNVDGLHAATLTNWDAETRLIEAHGRVGLYKCIPESDSDDESDDEDAEEDTNGKKRLVKLGNLKKCRALRHALQHGTTTGSRMLTPCKYEIQESITVRDMIPGSARQILSGEEFFFTSDEQRVEVSCSPTKLTALTSQSTLVAASLFVTASHIASSSLPSACLTSESSSSPSERSDEDDEGDNSTCEGKSHFFRSSSCHNRQSSIMRSSTSRRKHMSSLQSVVKSSESVTQAEHVENGICGVRGTGAKRLRHSLNRKSFPVLSSQLLDEHPKLITPPLCPNCRRPCPPQALLFDEGYHSHAYYQFERAEEWISNADVLVFVGTSFAVTITDVALAHAREYSLPVFNFNIESGNGDGISSGVLESNARLNVENIIGDVCDTLPLLLSACCVALEPSSSNTKASRMKD